MDAESKQIRKNQFFHYKYYKALGQKDKKLLT